MAGRKEPGAIGTGQFSDRQLRNQGFWLVYGGRPLEPLVSCITWELSRLV